jgi:hypothetical protein
MSPQPPAPSPQSWFRDRVLWVLGGILVGGFLLRVWSLGHGLPFAFNADEELHFVPVAVDMFAKGSLNPGYFENPPALTYLFYLAFKLRFTAGFPFGGDGIVRNFATDPEPVFLTARAVVAVLGTILVGLVYWAGARFYERRVGLVAAALMAFAFVPVFYSKQALNDMVTLLPLTVALVACLLVLERGALRDWLLAGAAIGVAAATKYTAGAMVGTLALAALIRLLRREDGVADVLRNALAAGVAFGIVFLALNPYSLLDFSEFKSQVGGQAGTAGGSAKLGQADVPGWIYYVWTLTWGLGWLPTVAIAAGAVLALRSNWRRGLLLLAFPVLLFLFLGGQERYFARWFLPAYPMLAVLAGYATVRLADALPVRPRWRAAVLPALAALLVVQGVASNVRVDSLLAKTDTRTLALGWLDRHVPARSGMVVEPFIPQNWLSLGQPRGEDPWRRFPVKRPFQAYEKKIEPSLLDRYRAGGYCWVVVGSHQKERGLEEDLPNARAYYQRLAAESTRAAVFSPYYAGEGPVDFNFDWSFDYLPRAYLRPGPVVEVYRLRGCG